MRWNNLPRITVPNLLDIASLASWQRTDRCHVCSDLASEEYAAWHRANADWLVPYAVFCFLKATTGTADHRAWGALAAAAPAHAARLSASGQPFHRALLFTYWLQWHLHKQLLSAADYSRERGVVLKGDLPIGVAKESADTWMHPELFRMDVGVGSPPDAFDPNGQNWGFPGVLVFLWCDALRCWRCTLQCSTRLQAAGRQRVCLLDALLAQQQQAHCTHQRAPACSKARTQDSLCFPVM